jgi:hypothetical protein
MAGSRRGTARPAGASGLSGGCASPVTRCVLTGAGERAVRGSMSLLHCAAAATSSRTCSRRKIPGHPISCSAVAVMTLAGRIWRSSSTASRDAATPALMSSGMPAVSRCFAVVSGLTTVRCSSLAVPAGSATTRETAAASCHCSRTSLAYRWASTRIVVDYRPRNTDRPLGPLPAGHRDAGADQRVLDVGVDRQTPAVADLLDPFDRSVAQRPFGGNLRRVGGAPPPGQRNRTVSRRGGGAEAEFAPGVGERCCRHGRRARARPTSLVRWPHTFTGC